MKTRPAIYTRISKHNDRVPKVEDQEIMCRRLAAGADYEVVVVYTDAGINASKGLNRPDWNQMLADAQTGKFDVLIAQSDDRFTRQSMEKETLALTCISAGIIWHTVNEGVVDPSTAEGGLRSGLSTLLASYETRRKSERQKQANDAIRAKGLPLAGGDRPSGWKVDKVTLEPSEADLIKQAYADFVSGRRTLSNIRTGWNSAGVTTSRGKPWDIAKVEKILRRPRNVQRVRRRGELLKDEFGNYVVGQWKRMVDDDTYAAAVARLNDPKRLLTRKHEPKWLLSSLVTCGGCGGPMRGVTRTKDKGYRCAVHDGQGHKVGGIKHVSIASHLLDSAVIEAVVSVILMAPGDLSADPDTSTLNVLHTRLERLRNEATRLVEAVRVGMDLEDVAVGRRQIRAETEAVEQEITSIAERNAQAALMSEARRALWNGSSMSITETAKVKREIRVGFDALDLGQQRALVRGMVKVTLHKGRGSGRIEIEHLSAKALNESLTAEHEELIAI